MAQHAAPSALQRFVLMANTASQPARGRKLVDGVAAQDLLAALFDEFAEEQPSSRAHSTDRAPLD